MFVVAKIRFKPITAIKKAKQTGKKSETPTDVSLFYVHEYAIVILLLSQFCIH